MKEKEEGAKPQKSGFLVRLTALAATAALLLGALTLVVYRDRFNLDALRRWFEYRSWRPARQVKPSHLPMQVGSRRPLPI